MTAEDRETLDFGKAHPRLLSLFSAIGRAALGVLAGGMLGSVTHLFVLIQLTGSPEGSHWLGTCIGALFGAALGLLAGGKEVSGTILAVGWGIIGGMILGYLGGMTYANQMAIRKGATMKQKPAGYQREGIAYGVPIGTGLGALAGLGFAAIKGRFKSRNKGPKSPSQ
jgi:hypothetical protein